MTYQQHLGRDQVTQKTVKSIEQDLVLAARKYDPKHALTPANPTSGSQIVIITNPLGGSDINTVI